jgi:hypothetical protein
MNKKAKLRFLKLGIMIGIMLMGLFLTFIQVPEETEAATVLPIATIGLDQPTQTADVSPGSLGTVEFSGTVSCELNSATTAIVSLMAQDTWGSATVVPSALQFSNTDGGDKVFRVSVKAPLYTSRNTVGQVVITGRVVMYPSSLYGTVQPRDGIVGRIDIEPFYKFQLNAPSKYQEVGPGQQLVYNVHIANQGNIRDTFQIEIENEDKLTEQGFVISLSQRVIDVEELEEKVVKLTVNTPIEWNIWKNKVTGVKVNVFSMLYFEETGTPLNQIEVFKVRERGFSTPGFDPMLMIIAFIGIAIAFKTKIKKERKRLK